MKITEILDHVTPGLRATAELYANRFGASRALFSEIRLHREDDLMQFADWEVESYNRRRGFHFEILRPEKRLLNIAERLVVAVRIMQYSRTEGGVAA